MFELATIQHGVISTRQLGELGYSPSSVAKAAKAGRLRRLHRGVYAVGHGELNWHGRCLAAVLASAPAVASHLSAAWLLGLLRYRPAAVHVTATSRRRSRRSFHVHFADLAAADRDEVDGVPVTSLARTLLDLAAIFSPVRLERALERAEERKVFDLGTIDELLDRVSRHPGAGCLRRALAINRPAAFTRSGVERRFLGLVKAAGLPAPAMNFVVGGFELDAYWEPERFAVELDVYETHGSRRAFERDRLRQEELKLIGVETIRITGRRLDREPKRVAARVAELLEQRRRQIAASQAAGAHGTRGA